MGKDNAKIEGGRSNFWALISRMRVVALALLVRMMQPRLWPWGLAQPWTNRMKYSPLDLMNDSLQIKRKSKLQGDRHIYPAKRTCGAPFSFFALCI